MTIANSSSYTLSVLPGPLAVCRLDPSVEIPAWATGGPFSGVTRTPEELSVVCPERRAPPDARCERGWRALKLKGPFDLALTGVLLSVAAPLAEAGVNVFVISTYDTDYVLVPEALLQRAVSALTARGHEVRW